MTKDGALDCSLIYDDECELARTIRYHDQMGLYAFAGEFIALQPTGGVIADLTNVAATQSPAAAGNGGRGGLSSGKYRGGQDLGLRVEGGEAGHTDERVGGVEADRDDIGASGRGATRIGGWLIGFACAISARRHGRK